MNANDIRKMIHESVGEVVQEMAKPNTRKVNNEIHALTTNRYFDSIPTKELQDILDKYGMGVNVETNEKVMDGIYTGTEGRMSEPVGRNQRGEANMYFVMTWYKMPSKRYEIVAYVW